MAVNGNAANITPVHELGTNPEKAVPAEPDFRGEIEQDFEDKRPGPGDKPEDATQLEDAGPPDGGAAAWLVVLGAWCCSFSSPGWMNSTYFLYRPNAFLACRYGAPSSNEWG